MTETTSSSSSASTTALSIPDKAIEELEVHLVARSTDEMNQCRSQLTDWLSAKIRSVQAEVDELVQARDMAIKQKWGNAALKRHVTLATKRLTFYEKVRAAVAAGYTIVPNFPVDMFAVRTKRNHPRSSRATSTYSQDSASRNAPDVKPEILPVGEGRYVSPTPIGEKGHYQYNDDKGKTVTEYYFDTTDFSEVEFPIETARPLVMNAAAEAMALKCFDAIGICHETRNEDPLIIGQVLTEPNTWRQKRVSFLIAWHLDLRTL